MPAQAVRAAADAAYRSFMARPVLPQISQTSGTKGP